MTILRSRFLIAIIAVIYGMTGTPVLASVVAAASECDPEHTMRVELAGGKTRVILHHSIELTPRPSDHHREAGRVITLLCGTDGHGDHVFEQTPPDSTILDSFSGTKSEKADHPLPPSLVVVRSLGFVVHETCDQERGDILTRSREPRCGLGSMALLI